MHQDSVLDAPLSLVVHPPTRPVFHTCNVRAPLTFVCFTISGGTGPPYQAGQRFYARQEGCR